MKLGSNDNYDRAAIGIIFQLDNGKIQSCNPAAESILGYTAAEMIAVVPEKISCSTIFQEGYLPLNTHPAIAFANSKSVAAALAGQSGIDEEIGFYQPNGRLVWLRLNSQPMFTGNSEQPLGVVTTFQDITATKTKPSHEDYQGLQIDQDFKRFADAVPGVLYVFDAISQQNIYLNSQAFDLLGYTSEEIIAMGDKFRSQVMHPEDLAQFSIHLAKLERSQPGEVVKLEYQIRHANGQWRYFSTQDRVYSRTADGRIEQIIGVARDISSRKQAEIALKESEARLKLATATSGVGMWFWNIVEDRLEWTEQGKAIFGLPPEIELTYDMFFELLHPEDRDRVAELIRQALANKTEYSAEYRTVWSDGSIRWIVARGKGFYDHDGTPFRMMGIIEDITAAKQSEQELIASKELLRLALCNAKAGTWDWNIEQQEIFWSPENYQLYGIDSCNEHLQYQDWAQTLHPEDLERSNAAVEQVLTGEISEFRIEFRIIHPQHGTRWLLGIGNVTHDHNGKPIRLSGINLDISHLKETESALLKSRQQLRILLDSLPISTGFLNTQGVVIEVNQTALNSAALQPEDVLNKHFSQTYWWSYSAEVQMQIDEAIQRAAAGEMVRFDIIARVKDDNLIVTDFGIVPQFDDQGKVEYLVPFVMDVSDREASKQALKQRERELELITEVIPQQIWTAAIDGHIDYINQRWQDYTGLDLEQMRHQGWATIVHPDDLQAIRDKWIEAITTEGKFDLEVRLRRADGSYRWFLSKARPLRSEQGKIVKWYGTNTGITRIKELEAELLQQTKELTNANQLKDEFLAIVSHELRTPLNPILGWSQLLSGGRLDADKISIGIRIIEQNAKLQAQLIDDLLDVSQILRDKLSLNKIPLNMEPVIRSSLTTLQLAMGRQVNST